MEQHETPPLVGFWDRPQGALLDELQATATGLTSDEAKRRLRLHGPNSLVQESALRSAARVLLRFFANPLVIILLVASAVSLALGDRVGGSIIIAIVLLSVLLNFYMEFQARHAVEEIRKQVATTAAVLRDGQEQELPIAELVPGDVVRLNAGDLVPADARLLEEKDLHVRESALTGESLPVEKAAGDLPAGKHGIARRDQQRLPGHRRSDRHRRRGRRPHGRDTAFGAIAERLAARPPETEFDRGIRHFGLMITRVIMLLVLFVLLVNIVLHRPLLESLLFAIALAVGLTPELLPMIITVTLAQGARRMARRRSSSSSSRPSRTSAASRSSAATRPARSPKARSCSTGTWTSQGNDDDSVLQLHLPEQLLRGRASRARSTTPS